MVENLRPSESENLLVTGYRPEVAVQIITMLAEYFTHQWGDDFEFRRRMVEEVQSFLMQLDHPLNGVVCAWEEETLVGAVAIDALNQPQNTARIRWFIVDEQYRGQGYGRFLFEKAIEHCKQRGHDRIIISTFKGKDPAVILYPQYGFTLFSEQDFSTSTTKITEQWFELNI